MRDMLKDIVFKKLFKTILFKPVFEGESFNK